jgi:hypothetical protein
MENKLTYSIYRKATATDTIIHSKSCHPIQHKMSAINYMTNILNTYPLNKCEINAEIDTIKHILQQNQYQINNSIKQKLNKGNTTNQNPPKENLSIYIKAKPADFLTLCACC